ncbi:protein kinase-like domain protein [Colletotrichum karsti]|uniref:non-specific serine/threonine protein kinase n=1 Tax=Colletotrichum karsti TaxID=1095194 RepID=A0A9P6HZC5_9PEZI|nr:protein kinase-like domain protein [Colletotrichum karsti]KAF9872932.1 protein kinase-like domain protein [Colletotrichum karsti]
MIDPEFRYFAPGGFIQPGGPSTWHILDWDQRRVIAVTMDEEQDSEDLAIEHLEKHIDTLPPDVYAIHVSHDGHLISTSTDPEDDETTCVYYPPLEELQRPEGLRTITRSDLEEIDRICPNVDLVSYQAHPGVGGAKKVVFKYYFLYQFMHKLWHEMNLWMRLPPHPNIVKFDRLVVDELDGHVVGFTNVYIPGGTIEDNRARVFKLKWLEQLTRVVDDLNLKHGIVHQDIAARNLLVDPSTDNLLLFDFNHSGRIGGDGHVNERDDVKGVIFTLYEIITRDKHFREVPHDQQNPADVQSLDTWPQHQDVHLDRPVSEYRSVLDRWVQRRQEGKRISVYTEAEDPIDWPLINPPPEPPFLSSDAEGNPITKMVSSWAELRQSKRQKGEVTLDWERPPQNRAV